MPEPLPPPQPSRETLRREFERLREAVDDNPELRFLVERMPEEVPEPETPDSPADLSSEGGVAMTGFANNVQKMAHVHRAEPVTRRQIEFRDFTPMGVWSDPAAFGVKLAPRPMRLEDKKAALDTRQRMYLDAARELAVQLKQGRIESDEWLRRMMGEVRDLHTTSYAIGYSGRWDQLSNRDWGAVGNVVQRQYRFLRQWRRDILQQDLDDITLASLVDRAQKYGAAASESFEKGYSAEVGMPPNILPAYPGDGTTECMCITTPTSRVRTKRGWVPLYKVRVGDKVWTHKRRWRPVTAVNVKPSKPTHREAYVRAPTGQLVGATGNHKWHTSEGWRSVNDIDNGHSNPYIMRAMDSHLPEHAPHAEALHELREAIRKQGQNRPLHRMSEDLPRMRRGEGSSVRPLQVLRVVQNGEEAVGGRSRENGGGDLRGHAQKAPTVRGYFRGHQLERARGRAPLHLLLGRRRKAVHLPLSVEVATEAWRDPRGSRDSPQEWRPVGRPHRELGVSTKWGAQTDARGRKRVGQAVASRSKAMPGVWNGVHGSRSRQPPRKVLLSGMLQRRKSQGAAPRRVCSLRGGVQSNAVGQLQSHPEILFEGLLPRSTAVFDLEVAEDHSFCIEGLFAHNTRCKCRWGIQILDKQNQDFNCTWKLGIAEHCETCIRRAQSWFQLEVRNGVLASDPEPIFAR